RALDPLGDVVEGARYAPGTVGGRTPEPSAR
ncbi:MAG: hypothetical protein QOI50_4198, partial [Pseudonocardiales bacterium]|nr:hypothetical protein [Pseudonocardiales bacterium]